jgi:hypothetical protein
VFIPLKPDRDPPPSQSLQYRSYIGRRHSTRPWGNAIGHKSTHGHSFALVLASPHAHEIPVAFNDTHAHENTATCQIEIADQVSQEVAVFLGFSRPTVFTSSQSFARYGRFRRLLVCTSPQS